MLNLVEFPESDLEVSSPRSKTSLAYERIRADILAGRLKPGERLKIAELGSTLDVSPGAIREALSRLVPEQLVVSRDQKGFVVSPLSIEDLKNLTELRCEIEAMALRQAIANGNSEWEGAILGAAHRLRRAQRSISNSDPSLTPEWVERHAEFHAALVAACPNRRIVSLHVQLYQQSERYRGALAYTKEGVARDVDGEHQELVDAALDRNADKLISKTVEHIHRTTTAIIEASRQSLVEVVG
jgi:DNA-binding GntR family transcriptional regulator